NYHQTRDSFGVSDAAAQVLRQAHFPPGHTCACDCLEEGSKIQSSDCKNLNIHDADGKRIATFSLADFQAVQSDDGGIMILRRAAATKDARRRLTIADIQRFNEGFHARPDMRRNHHEHTWNAKDAVRSVATARG